MFLITIIFISIYCLNCVSEKVTFINVEHPQILYRNPDYFSFLNLTTTRYGRVNPLYYVGLHYESIETFENNVTVDFFFHEFLTNQYKASFIEFHFTWCHLTEKDMFFGAALRQGKLKKPCPHLAGVYDLYNMTINPAVIPKGFPFTKGRIYCNVSTKKTKSLMASGFVDFKILQIDRTKMKVL